MPMGEEVPLERGRQRGVPLLKRRYFAVIGSHSAVKRLQIGTNMLLIITSAGDSFLNFMNIDDFERPWTLKMEFLMIFFRSFWLQRTFQHWIATKWLEIDQENLRTKFSAINVDFSSPSPDPKVQGGRRRRASKTATSPKKWLFSAIISCSV